jgi:Phosphotransferase enzyme family
VVAIDPGVGVSSWASPPSPTASPGKIDAVASLAAVIADQLDGKPFVLESEVFEATDPIRIAELVTAFCRAELGEDVIEGLFYRASVGCIVGVVLGSGRSVVLKAYQVRWRDPFLRAVQRVQRRLSEAAYPCAMPVGDPAPLCAGSRSLVTVEGHLEDPGMRPLSGWVDRQAVAQALALQIALAKETDGSGLAGHPLAAPGPSTLYPSPHSPLFDFEATSAGAGWIDDVARRAKVERDQLTSPPVVAHCDWSARNVRVVGPRVVAAYDWDSLSLVPESSAVGQAAATWCVTSEPGGAEFPDGTERAAFVSDYEIARGKPFSAPERASVAAAAAWVLAYTARCEHALEATGIARHDQRGARQRLRSEGEGVFDLGGDGVDRVHGERRR